VRRGGAQRWRRQRAAPARCRRCSSQPRLVVVPGMHRPPGGQAACCRWRHWTRASRQAAAAAAARSSGGSSSSSNQHEAAASSARHGHGGKAAARVDGLTAAPCTCSCLYERTTQKRQYEHVRSTTNDEFQQNRCTTPLSPPPCTCFMTSACQTNDYAAVASLNGASTFGRPQGAHPAGTQRCSAGAGAQIGAPTAA
jgi:hypothetical protein